MQQVGARVAGSERVADAANGEREPPDHAHDLLLWHEESVAPQNGHFCIEARHELADRGDLVEPVARRLGALALHVGEGEVARQRRLPRRRALLLHSLEDEAACGAKGKRKRGGVWVSSRGNSVLVNVVVQSARGRGGAKRTLQSRTLRRRRVCDSAERQAPHSVVRDRVLSRNSATRPFSPHTRKTVITESGQVIATSVQVPLRGQSGSHLMRTNRGEKRRVERGGVGKKNVRIQRREGSGQY
eukprot:3322552-Pleurochrysis_carterae.AAC.2